MQYLPKNYPDRRVLGVIIPTAEEVVKYERVGVLATTATVNSGAYVRELKKLKKNIRVIQEAAPLLVPLIESDGLNLTKPVLEKYLKPLQKSQVQAILLACTHYPILKNQVREILGKEIKIISQTDIIPGKLKAYLKRHKEIDKQLSKKRKREFYITVKTEAFIKFGRRIIGRSVNFKIAKID
jgi:glutamate racemase